MLNRLDLKKKKLFHFYIHKERSAVKFKINFNYSKLIIKLNNVNNRKKKFQMHYKFKLNILKYQIK